MFLWNPKPISSNQVSIFISRYPKLNPVSFFCLFFLLLSPSPCLSRLYVQSCNILLRCWFSVIVNFLHISNSLLVLSLELFQLYPKKILSFCSFLLDYISCCESDRMVKPCLSFFSTWKKTHTLSFSLIIPKLFEKKIPKLNSSAHIPLFYLTLAHYVIY